MMGWHWHQLDHMKTICTSLQTDNHAGISSLKFYRPDSLPTNSVKALKTDWHLLVNSDCRDERQR